MKVDKFRTVIIYIIIILLGLVCLLPLLNIVAISFSSSAAVEGNMVGLIPVGFSTAAYKKILEDSQFWHSFLISVERVVLALIINFVLIVLMAYPLSKTNAQFRGRNIYANLMIFAMLFNGGMIYMSKAAYYPLMTYIQSLQINVEDLIKQGNLSAVVDSAALGNTNLNAAKIVVAVIPLLLIYPLLQRYFVSGIVVGSVKG